MITFVARVLLIVISASIGYMVGETFFLTPPLYTILGLVAGALLAFIVIGVEYLTKKFSFEGLVAPTVGIILGMVTANFVVVWLDLVIPERFELFKSLKPFLSITLALFLGYIGFIVGIKLKGDLRLLPAPRFGSGGLNSPKVS